MNEYVVYSVEVASATAGDGNFIVVRWDRDKEEWVYTVEVDGRSIEEMHSPSDDAMQMFFTQAEREILAQVMTAMADTGRAVVTEWLSPAVRLDPMNGENSWVIMKKRSGPGAYEDVPDDVAEHMGYPYISEWKAI